MGQGNFKLNDESLMTFGHWKGWKMKDVPASYFLWLADQPWAKTKYAHIMAYVETRRDVLEDEVRRKSEDNKAG